MALALYRRAKEARRTARATTEKSAELVAIAPHEHVSDHNNERLQKDERGQPVLDAAGKPLHPPRNTVTEEAILRRHPADFFVFTEHDGTYLDRKDESLPFAGRGGAIAGSESSARIPGHGLHHIGLWGITKQDVAEQQIRGKLPLRDLAGKVHGAGGVVVLNHPNFPSRDETSREALDWSLGGLAAQIDAIEVFNNSVKENPELWKWIDEQVLAQPDALTDDHRISFVSGLDEHGPQVKRDPMYTMAMAQKTKEGVLGAVKSGQMYISKNPQIQIGPEDFSINGHSLGSEIPLFDTAAHTVKLSLRRLPVDSLIEVYCDGVVFAAGRSETGSFEKQVAVVPNPARPMHYVFLRVSHAGETYLVTSPIPFRLRAVSEQRS